MLPVGERKREFAQSKLKKGLINSEFRKILHLNRMIDGGVDFLFASATIEHLVDSCNLLGT